MCQLGELTFESTKMTDEIRLLVKTIKDEKSIEDVLEALPFMVLIKDNKGNITDCNKKFCNIMGQTKEKLLGQGWRNFGSLSTQQMEQYFLNDTRVIETGAVTEIFEHLPNDVSTPIVTYKSPLRIREKIVGVIAVSLNITNIVNFVRENKNELSR